MRKSAELSKTITTLENSTKLLKVNARQGYENGKPVIVVDKPVYDALMEILDSTIHFVVKICGIFMANGD